MMTEEDIEAIRNEKKKKMLEAHHNKEIPPEALPWSFRHNHQSGYFEIMQSDNMVSLTLDPKWAVLVCDLLNSLVIAQSTQGLPE